MNLPNKITIIRILLIPIMMIIPLLNLNSATLLGCSIGDILMLVIFLVASFTDYLDGYIARKKNLVTNFGKFLDPIADKLLVFAALVILVESGRIPGWIVTLTAAREFLVAAVRMIVASEGTVIAASWLGKVKTVSQMIAISLAFIDVYGFFAFLCMGKEMNIWALILNILTSIAMLVSVVATIWSGTDYFMKSKDVVLKSK